MDFDAFDDAVGAALLFNLSCHSAATSVHPAARRWGAATLY